MLTIKIHIGEETRKGIKSVYGKDDYVTVEGVVGNIVGRYLDIEHFDPKLSIDADNNYQLCESCEEKSKCRRIIDVDGRHLEEREVCENCGSGYPALK